MTRLGHWRSAGLIIGFLLIFAGSFAASPWREGTRVDPLLALPIRLALAPFLAFCCVRDGRIAWLLIAGVAALVAITDAILETMLATRVAVDQNLLAGMVVAVAMAVTAWAYGTWPRYQALVVVAAGITGLLLGRGLLTLVLAASAPAQKPKLLLVTSLPLSATMAATASDVLQGKSSDSPALQRLERDFTVTLTPAPACAQLDQQEVLLAAHPPALAPQSLADLDAWVRAGGKALILADAYSSWHPPFALGDPRNPPVTSLLTPLLTHWGVTLDLAHDDMEENVREAISGATRLRIVSAGRFHLASPSNAAAAVRCAVSQDGLIAECTVGKGRAILVADADLLDEHLWQGESPDADRSGNMIWLMAQLHRLAGRSLARSWLEPVWRRF